MSAENEVAEQVAEGVTKKIVHEIKFVNDKKDDSEAEKNRNIIETLSLKQFSDEKEVFLDELRERGYDDSKINEMDELISDGKTLDHVRDAMTIVDTKTDSNEGEPKKTTVGKVRGRSPSNQDEGEFSIDKLYDSLEKERYLVAVGSKDGSQERLNALQSKADALLSSLILGEQNRHHITSIHGVSSCPKCNATMTDGICKNVSIEIEDFLNRLTKEMW